jgi:hypothetical protein
MLVIRNLDTFKCQNLNVLCNEDVQYYIGFQVSKMFNITFCLHNKV